MACRHNDPSVRLSANGPNLVAREAVVNPLGGQTPEAVLTAHEKQFLDVVVDHLHQFTLNAKLTDDEERAKDVRLGISG